jgi:dihydropteroate synthase
MCYKFTLSYGNSYFFEDKFSCCNAEHLKCVFLFSLSKLQLKSIHIKGKLHEFSTPCVMGIINVTPDSFYDGGTLKTDKTILSQAEKMLNEGAVFLDVGGYSSRPDADDVSENEETERVVPVVALLVKNFPEVLLSVDTFRSGVAQKAVEAGAALINDISAGELDSKMLSTVASLNVPYIMMHMRGTPKTMQSLTAYDNITLDVARYFSKKIAAARALGITDIIVDPGFGFAKTTQQNFRLFNELDTFIRLMEMPVLVGISRKSMIYKTLGQTPQEALNGTTALHALALEKGAAILRVHDVKQAMECIQLHLALKNS